MALVIFCVALVAAMRTRMSLRLAIPSSPPRPAVPPVANPYSVMPGHMPGIHALITSHAQDVDDRQKGAPLARP